MGAGQASLLSLDGKGKVRMIYTQTVHDYVRQTRKSRTFWRDMDLSEADVPLIGEAVLMHTGGILNRTVKEKTAPVFNPSIVWDRKHDLYYMTREGTPFDHTRMPDFIAPYTGVSVISRQDFERNEGGWATIYNVDERDTGFYRNHNAGLIKDAYGWHCHGDCLPIIVTVSELKDQNFLWTYRLHYTEIQLVPGRTGRAD
ncbi:hypothetical protein RE628_18715 [Paenibacillus sp. D2_2]|uniref:hypothetical protein n=1 Tax=Paenibacillus sp. D2_2 TaxID=3073092 RepID=UPI0028157DA7|nr:hypothetical protein [Paenibacillus sp. D2_2]WMT39447.1 hypothetical protein RE628_18715 [Paenibacillus sp. D2_2]